MISQSKLKRSRLDGTMDDQTFEWRWRPALYKMYDRHPYVVSARLAFYLPPDIEFIEPANFFNQFIRNSVYHIRHNQRGGSACHYNSFWRLKKDSMGYGFYECILLIDSSYPALYLQLHEVMRLLWTDYLKSHDLHSEMQNLCFITEGTKHILTSYSENGVQLILGQFIDVNLGDINDPRAMIWNPMELKTNLETPLNSPAQ